MRTDCIGSASANVNRTYTESISSSVARSSDTKVKSEGGEVRTPIDAFQSSDMSVTDDGSVRFILSFGKDVKTADTEKFLKTQENSGNTISSKFPLINGYSVDVKPENIDKMLTSLPVGTQIAVDRPLTFDNPTLMKSTSGAESAADKKVVADVSDALIGINEVWDMGYTGKGQTIAIIDSGIYPHPDLEGKITGWVDMQEGTLKPTDTYGHGTHVAGIAAGSGVKSAGVHKGVAPDANVVGVRISNVSEAIKGIQWVIENKDRLGIGVVNISLGDFAMRSYKDDPWAQAAEKAMEAGLVVCVAAGNDGPSERNISTPGTHPDVITVGALDDNGTLDRSDDKVADFSSRGPTNIDGINKPDLIAPGVDIYGPLAPNADIDNEKLPHWGSDYVAISGTSMATPMVAGVAACLKQANPNLTHKDVKEILVKSCDNYLDEPKNVQGAGLINAKKALELALTWETSQDIADLSKSSESDSSSAKLPVQAEQVSDSGFIMA
ncbi:MAG: S8 family peptidase [Candidatus Bruticola sp.]